jgi:hypothetical protein
VYGREAGVSEASLDAMMRLEQEHWKYMPPDAIFHVHRALPFRAEHDPVRFQRLSGLYLELADRSPKQNVLRLSNQGTIAEEVARILTFLGLRE